MGRLLPAAALVAVVLGAAPALTQRLDVFVGSREDPAIGYTLGPVDNPIARLDQRVRDGGLVLRRGEPRGYLDAVLEALDVPPASQTLVFSQTSAQADYVSMRRPRAVFFGDDVAVAWVPGAPVLEVAALDARQGTVFYTLDQQAGTPRFERQTSCLLCHQTWETLGVPGWQVLSTFPMSDDPRAYAGGIAMDHRTPFGERWGGWFVTRRSGNVPHMGNRPVVLPAHEVEAARRRPTRHLDSVRDEVEPLYPSTCSEVAAHLVLVHQSQAANLMTRAGWEARVAAGAAGASAANATSAGARARAVLASPRVREAAQDLAAYLVFEDEAPLPTPVDSGCGFVEAFARRGPRDAQGRSLREFDLRTRTFRYPVSYMVYSAAFSSLDEAVRRLVYAGMVERLLRPDRRGGPATADVVSRRVALEILRATVRDAALIPVP